MRGAVAYIESTIRVNGENNWVSIYMIRIRCLSLSGIRYMVPAEKPVEDTE
jgi:hypothetical protein